MDDEFRELIENAREAIDKLLDGSEHDSWTLLRAGYGEIRRALEHEKVIEEARARLREIREDAEELRGRVARLREEDDEEAEREAKRERERSYQDYRRRKDAWKLLDPRVKEGRILDALGNEALTLREIRDRVEQAAGGESEIAVYETTVIGSLRRLLDAGEVAREREPRTPGCTMKPRSGWRWRWHRVTVMSPEVADLERRLTGEAA